MATDGEGGVSPVELPMEAPGPGEVILRLHACGLCGTDLFKLDTDELPRGTVLGHELVGSVIARGEGATFSEGTRLAVPHHFPCGECDPCRRGSETMCRAFRENLLHPGGFSERVRVTRRGVERTARALPDSLSDEAALFLEPAACVVRGIRRSGLDLENRERAVAVIGSGSMGLLHLLVLRALGFEAPIVVVEPIEPRRRLASALGATATAAPGEPLPRLLGQGGAVVVFDTVGGEFALETALGIAAEGGSIVLFAHAPPGEQSRVDLHALFRHERRLVASYSGGPQDQDEAWRLLAEGALDPRPLISHTLPLTELARAVDLVRRREALKVVLTP